jgi:hypothetical protein
VANVSFEPDPFPKTGLAGSRSHDPRSNEVFVGKSRRYRVAANGDGKLSAQVVKGLIVGKKI